ncbi:dimethyl sulfoxide reductase anchor subunit family protein [Magnetofaba australis]|uniref:Putative Anaerobic dimethyl sulfoxide reductase chain C n=1 Tax=Magnetofaba australis IT-1 TaxID=1434232 RepID=A0A1Y2K5A1_9PROT|nr:DmsC/YnfH family molybdoenzyme membrane anchor subunit [Magnetofaba australis]OSM04416.1 putative Anaerobic dimethyl sulfoxide reductase chain C [Magnetofaba australis IT-1]
MKPAFSVIFLTTLIGAGQGLLFAMVTAQTYLRLQEAQPLPGDTFYALGALGALILLSLGLLASTFHLSHPTRGWRAIARWRTSWLSREVIMLPLFMGFVALYGVMHYFDFNQPHLTLGGLVNIELTLLVGWIASIVGLLLFICTGMVYASVKFLPEWRCGLTVVNYTLLGSASGYTAGAVLAVQKAGRVSDYILAWAIAITLTGMVTRIIQLRRNKRLRPAVTHKSAMGVHHGKIRQVSMGFMGGSYNTKEYFHGKSPSFVCSVKWAFLFLSFPIPIALLIAGRHLDILDLMFAAFIVQIFGLMLERWHFLADANHVQNIYYQTVG